MIVAGWYGKIASLGDFAARRLSPEFIARWDTWLQQVIGASRAQLGSAWLDIYLTSPVWRFVEWPPAEAAPFHIGVLMPSVDRVGRYFPLCVAAALPAPPAQAAEWQALVDWCDRIEAAAIATLDTGLGVEAFDGALRELPAPVPEQQPQGPEGMLIDSLCGRTGPAAPGALRHDRIGALLAGTAALSLARSAAGASLWWTRSNGDASLFGCPSLPDADRFITMLRPEQSPPDSRP